MRRPPDTPADLGYWVGYRIVKSYYRHADDKRQAIRNIFEMTNPDEFLARSGWRPGIALDEVRARCGTKGACPDFTSAHQAERATGMMGGIAARHRQNRPHQQATEHNGREYGPAARYVRKRFAIGIFIASSRFMNSRTSDAGASRRSLPAHIPDADKPVQTGAQLNRNRWTGYSGSWRRWRMAHRPNTQIGTPEAARARTCADETALMGRVAAEEMEAFESLYRLYHPRLTRFLEKMTQRPALVGEILDDTMLVVWRKAHTYNPSAKVSTWIFAIAWRQALKALRRIDDAVEFCPDKQAGSAGAEPDGALQQQELRARLDEALSVLSAEHRAVIELTYYSGYACREIAQIMGCPVDTVKTRMFYARRRLKTLLALDREEAV